MKIAWEESDITLGCVIGKESQKERFIIGFIPWEPGIRRYTYISLSDGMVTKLRTKRELAVSLTEGGYVPAVLLRGEKA